MFTHPQASLFLWLALHSVIAAALGPGELEGHRSGGHEVRHRDSACGVAAGVPRVAIRRAPSAYPPLLLPSRSREVCLPIVAAHPRNPMSMPTERLRGYLQRIEQSYAQAGNRLAAVATRFFWQQRYAERYRGQV